MEQVLLEWVFVLGILEQVLSGIHYHLEHLDSQMLDLELGNLEWEGMKVLMVIQLKGSQMKDCFDTMELLDQLHQNLELQLMDNHFQHLVFHLVDLDQHQVYHNYIHFVPMVINIFDLFSDTNRC